MRGLLRLAATKSAEEKQNRVWSSSVFGPLPSARIVWILFGLGATTFDLIHEPQVSPVRDSGDQRHEVGERIEEIDA